MTQKGTVLAFSEGREKSKDDAGPKDQSLKRSTDGGRILSVGQDNEERAASIELTALIISNLYYDNALTVFCGFEAD